MKLPVQARRVALAFVIGLAAALLFQRFAPAEWYDVGNNDFMMRDLPLAHRLLAGQVPMTPGSVFPIGFPLIIALVLKLSGWLGISLEAGMYFFQAVWMGLATVMIYLIAELVWGARLAWLAVLVWSIYPFALWLTGQLSTELPFIVFLYAGIWLVGRNWVGGKRNLFELFGAGILFGCAMMIRPVAVGVPLLLAILALFRPTMNRLKQMRLAALILFGAVVIVAPWEALVWQRTERFVLISTGDMPSILDGLTFGVRSKSYREGIPLTAGVATLMHNADARRAEFQSFGDVVSFMGDEWRSNSAGVFEFFVLKAGRSWYGTDSMRYETLILLVQCLYLSVGVWGLIQALRLSTNTRSLALMFLALILYFWAMTILVLPILRYMIPAMGLLIVLSPGTVQWFESRRHNTLQAEHVA